VKGLIFSTNSKYSGKYVATKSFSNHRVISSGKDSNEVRKEAQDKGCEHPVVFFVPQKDTVHIY
jgi:hypothetical protein